VLTEPIVPLLCVPPLPTPSVLHKLGLRGTESRAYVVQDGDVIHILFNV
jgi:hypothetical protein